MCVCRCLFVTEIYYTSAGLHAFMYVKKCSTSIWSRTVCTRVCICHREQNCFCMSASVSGHHAGWQCGKRRASLVDMEHKQDGKRGESMRERKKKEAEWSNQEMRRWGNDCVSLAVHHNSHLESITHRAVYFLLSHAITPPQTPHLYHFPVI